jgi:TRAP-type transport system small permease protein
MVSIFRAIDTIIRWLGTVALSIAAIFIGLLAIVGTADSIGTQVFAVPVPSALEFSQAGLVVVVFMGLAFAQRRRGHVMVDILSGRARGWGRLFFVGLALIAAIAFFSFLTWRGYVAATESIAIDERSLGLTRFPVYPAKIALCFGCFVAALESIRQFVHLCLGNPDAFEAHDPDEDAAI